MLHESVAINFRALRRLRNHMRKHHPAEFKRMITSDPDGIVNDIMFAGRSGGELATLNYACFDPTRFPVHVLADDTVVALVKKVQRGTHASFWVGAAREIWGLNQ